MKKTDTFVVAEHIGNAPFDFFYLAEYELTVEEEKKVYPHAAFWPDGTTEYAVAPIPMKAFTDDHQPDPIEYYETLQEASGSEYFRFFLELDRLTEQKAKETMDKVNDTKNYGFRTSGHWTEKGIMMYAECFNTVRPELNQYLQVRQTPEGYIYSASHKSHYMKIELEGQLEGFYKAYFGEPEKALYLFETTSLDDLGPYEILRDPFEKIVGLMKKSHQEIISGGKSC